MNENANLSIKNYINYAYGNFQCSSREMFLIIPKSSNEFKIIMALLVKMINFVSNL